MENLRAGAGASPEASIENWEFESLEKENEYFNNKFPPRDNWEGVLVRESKGLNPDYSPSDTSRKLNSRSFEVLLNLGQQNPDDMTLVHLYGDGDSERRDEAERRLSVLYAKLVGSKE